MMAFQFPDVGWLNPDKDVTFTDRKLQLNHAAFGQKNTSIIE
jgi:hypothetical protein